MSHLYDRIPKRLPTTIQIRMIINISIIVSLIVNLNTTDRTTTVAQSMDLDTLRKARDLHIRGKL